VEIFKIFFGEKPRKIIQISFPFYRKYDENRSLEVKGLFGFVVLMNHSKVQDFF